MNHFLNRLLILLLALPGTLLAFESIELELRSETVMNINHYPGNGSTLLIWLPAYRGLSAESDPVLNQLSAMGSDVWAVDLQRSFMVPNTRRGLDEIAASELVDMLQQASERGFKQIYFLASGNAARLALDSTRLFATEFPEASLLKGNILIHPSLFQALPAPGEKARFITSAALSHLPTYLIQGQYSTQYMYTEEISAQLQRGGSAVYVHRMPGVQGGFFSRDEDYLSEADLVARESFAFTLNQAMHQLAQTATAPLAPATEVQTDAREYVTSALQAFLSPYQGNKQPAPLKLPDLEGKLVDLVDHRGQVVLVNFWASWCLPCVEEIPSLTNLQDKMRDKPFRILAVNIGESAKTVRAFQQKLGFDMPIILDRQGSAVRAWNVYAYPTNFLIDKQGNIQYAYSGVLEWDSDQISTVIESMF